MKTVLITGANRGIGLGLVKCYLESGYRVIAACRNPERFPDGGAASSLSESMENKGPSVVRLKMDVSDPESIELAVLQLNTFGLKLDRVINNAGVCPLEKRGDWSAEAFAQTFRVNATGPALVAQGVIPLMNSGSKLVNMTSGMGSLELNLNPREGLDAYAMSKAALNILTRRLAVQLAEEGIAVYAISPGWVQTDMGGAEAPVGVDEAAPEIMKSIEKLSMEQSGLFLSENGETIPW
ncbi:SDR family oxidoreductase [Pontiella agarivorans]|uniref:SDR family oxidoreductase n=1 Tax=Pontiella agarivorans TaxID=3038953 RepID=A0ABU5MUC4_9BACT|nr:SDR family oxidoreductase [Pontiella agarivorans]MDZ8117815.1 SDR family oxidoreductase [Pontiella agarivorans]